MTRPVPAPLRFGLDYDGTALVCPSCGSPFTHQGTVEVWNRDEDEDREGVTVATDGATGIVAAGHNPSDRRRGVRVWFECEVCPVKFAVTIAQHKGQTIMGFEREPAVIGRPRRNAPE